MEHIRAHLTREQFAPHAHDTFLFGVTTGGVEAFVQRGASGVSTPGRLRLINAGEVHSGGPAEGLWTYEAIYVPGATLAAAAGRAGAPVFLSAPMADDADAAGDLQQLFEVLRTAREPLQREGRLLACLGHIVRRHGAPQGRHPSRAIGHDGIRRARELLADRRTERISLRELAAEAELSRFHLLRQFKASTGLTPWQYQAQQRIELARSLLRAGRPISQVAQHCGFVDQSHFSRVFKRFVGVPPGLFASGTQRAA